MPRGWFGERTQDYKDAVSERMSSRVVSEETRRNISESWKRNYEERCRAISKGHMGKVYSPELCEEMSQKRREEWTDPGIRARRIAGITEGLNRPEVRLQKSEVGKELWRNPDFRKVMLEAQAEGRKKKLTEGELVLLFWIKRYLPDSWRTNILDGKEVAGMLPDFLNEEKRQVIEMFGTFYHNEEWFPKKKTEEETIEAYQSSGYDCIVIWGDEVYVESLVVDKLHRFMGE